MVCVEQCVCVSVSEKSLHYWRGMKESRGGAAAAAASLLILLLRQCLVDSRFQRYRYRYPNTEQWRQRHPTIQGVGGKIRVAFSIKPAYVFEKGGRGEECS